MWSNIKRGKEIVTGEIVRCEGLPSARRPVDGGYVGVYSSKVELRQERAIRGRNSDSSPIGWEVVQLVGLQTLNLAILVRVQASQPILV
jgi:hypothetical protein